MEAQSEVFLTYFGKIHGPYTSMHYTSMYMYFPPNITTRDCYHLCIPLKINFRGRLNSSNTARLYSLLGTLLSCRSEKRKLSGK